MNKKKKVHYYAESSDGKLHQFALHIYAKVITLKTFLAKDNYYISYITLNSYS